MSLSFLVSAWAVKEMQVKMAHKASGIEDRRMKTSPFEREGTDFIISSWRYKKPGAGPGSYSSVERIWNALFYFFQQRRFPFFTKGATCP
jgi:hypothetical protein